MQRSQSPILTFSALEKKIAWTLFGVLWIFLFIRAIYVPVLHDEIATFFYYIQSGNYLPPKAHWDANNHVLNSFFAHITYSLFGDSPLSLRLPNVLSYALFFFGAFQLAGRLKHVILRWGLLLALVCSHYMFEYFGECRGYGMSMAFFIVALFQLVRLKETNRSKHILFFAFFLFLSTAANLTLILPAVILFGIVFLHLFFAHFKTDKILFFKRLGIVFAAGLPFLLLVKLSFAFKERGAFYYGGDSGFYDVTVGSLSQVFTDFYNLPIAILITVIFGGLVLHSITRLFQKKSLTALLDNATLFPAVLAANIMSILFLFHKMEVNFPEDRVAMHLFILFILSFAFILDDLALSIKKLAFAGFALSYFPLLFIYHISPTASVFSSEERTSYPIFDYVQNAPNSFKFPHLIGGYKTQEFCWYYLSNRAGGNEGKIHINYHIALDADFQIVRDGRIKDSILFDFYSPVISDSDTKLTLFERKTKLPKKCIYTADVIPTPGTIDYEYHNILEIEIDSLIDKTLFIGAEMTFNADSKPFHGWVAATVNDDQGNSLYQEYIALDWLRKNWDGTQNNFLQGTLLHHIPEGAKVLKFYIWNIDKTTFSIPDGKCYLYELERDFPNQY